ncbi:MAG TPA: hypothetical protein VFT66_14275 [Roseiflexaceae bacterium]|nr:hypothetical protein [Roseiflexaceae bacterium]
MHYVKKDGLPGFYSPDFMVRTANAIYLAETKAQDQTSHPNVLPKRKAAAAAGANASTSCCRICEAVCYGITR